MAITYHSIASTPVNAGSNSTSPTVVTPPGSMQSGDLVIVVCHNRLGSDTHAVSNNGGQSWTKLTTVTAALVTTTWFYCIFDGTWDASPSFSHGGTNNTCMMIVLRPTSGYSWSVDVAENPTTFSAPSTPFDVTITGITCVSNSVAIASWASRDDNTWALQSGASWTQPATATVNNLAGSDSGVLMAYRLMPSGGDSGSPVGRETTYGGDLGCQNIMSFKEVMAASPISGSTAGIASVSGNLTGKGKLAGVATGIALLIVSILGIGSLAGSVTGSSLLSGNLTEAVLKVYGSGSSDGMTSISGNLTGEGELSGSTDGITSVSGNLIGRGILSGITDGVTLLSGDLKGKGNLMGQVSGITLLSGNLTEKPPNALKGNSDGIASLVGDLKGKGSLAGQVNGVAIVSGILTGTGELSGIIDGITSLSGNLTEKPSSTLKGNTNGISSVLGNLIGNGKLSGMTNGIAGVSGNLTEKGTAKLIYRSGSYIIKDNDIFPYLDRITLERKKASAIHLKGYFSRITVDSEEPQNPSHGDIWIPEE